MTDRTRRILLIAGAVLMIAIALAGTIIPQVSEMNTRYRQAQALMERGDYAEAAETFESLGSYRGGKRKALEARLKLAEVYEQEGKFAHAALIYYKAGDEYRERSLALWDQGAVRDTVACGRDFTVAVHEDGTVVGTGSNEYGKRNFGSWTDIVAVSVGCDHTVGLRSDGTVVAVGDNEESQCDVSQWNDIVAIAASDFVTFGLRADGTVTCTGLDSTSNFKDIFYWEDILSISASPLHIVGLRADGQAVAAGVNLNHECNVEGWSDLAAVSCGPFITVAQRSDGSLTAVGMRLVSDDLGLTMRQYDQIPFTELRGVTTFRANGGHIVGLMPDGTVVSFGDNDHGQCDVSDWTDIVAVYEGIADTIGLRADGTLVAVGGDYNGRLDVSDWTNIKLPNRP